MAKYISHVDLTETLGLTECKDGFWLYDKTREMNLAMRAKTKEEAFVDALEYYQERLKYMETEYQTLRYKVDGFLDQFKESDDD